MIDVTTAPILSLNSAARFVVAVVIAVLVLKVVQQQAPRLVWPYVGLVLLGVAIYNREGLTNFLASLTSGLQGGQT